MLVLSARCFAGKYFLVIVQKAGVLILRGLIHTQTVSPSVAASQKAQSAPSARLAGSPVAGSPFRKPRHVKKELSFAARVGFLLLVSLLAFVEIAVVHWAGVLLWPFALCASFFVVAATLLVAYSRRFTVAILQRVQNALLLVLICKLFVSVVGVTGGLGSPFGDALLLPIFLGALYFGGRGSVAVASTLIVYFCGPWAEDWFGPLTLLSASAHAAVLLLVALICGLGVDKLNDATEQVARRASEVEWLTDTAVMMQSLLDVEYMLSVALLHLDDQIGNDAAAIYIRNAEDAPGSPLRLAQDYNIGEGNGQLPALSPEQTYELAQAEHEVLYWPDMFAEPDTNLWRRVDKSARSVIVVPLRMVEDVFGAMVVVAKRPYAFSPNERELLLRYARHIVPPIQRMRLQTQATTDALTGLANRRAFRRRLIDEMERAHRYKSELSLLLLDIDHFKRVNDTFGHPSGDAILSQIGVILSQVPRATDFAARYGGEEMAIICPQTGSEAAAILAERIRARVEGTHFALPDGESLRVTISVGVATAPGHAHDADSLLARTDDVLYDAKEAGRNRVHTADGGARPQSSLQLQGIRSRE